MLAARVSPGGELGRGPAGARPGAWCGWTWTDDEALVDQDQRQGPPATTGPGGARRRAIADGLEANKAGADVGPGDPRGLARAVRGWRTRAGNEEDGPACWPAWVDVVDRGHPATVPPEEGRSTPPAEDGRLDTRVNEDGSGSGKGVGGGWRPARPVTPRRADDFCDVCAAVLIGARAPASAPTGRQAPMGRAGRRRGGTGRGPGRGLPASARPAAGRIPARRCGPSRGAGQFLRVVRPTTSPSRAKDTFRPGRVPRRRPPAAGAPGAAAPRPPAPPRFGAWPRRLPAGRAWQARAPADGGGGPPW